MVRDLFRRYLLGLAAGAVGGYLGYRAVGALMWYTSLWAPILPGAFGGLACGQVSPVASKARGVLNGLLGLGIAIFAQWRLFDPAFEFDGTFGSYLAHLGQLPKLTLALFAVNAALAGYWGRERGLAYGRGPGTG